MPRNGSGTYAAPSSSWNPGVDGQAATTQDWNGLLEDLSAAVSQSQSADGQTPTTALIPFAYGIGVEAGSITSPAIQVIGDPTTGVYAPGAGQLAFICSGTNVLTLSSTGLTFAKAATFDGNLTAGANASLAGAGATLGFYGATGTTRPTVSGAKGGNAALGSLISALSALGLITDATSA